VRAMIVAAGLGTRLQPLTQLRPKPIVPVRGIPLIAYTLALLARHGVTEAVINAHHLPDLLIDTARRVCPGGLTLRFSIESELLDTGGAIRQVAEFLSGSDPCLIVGGDMLLDANLTKLVASHRDSGAAVTMLLAEHDRHADSFGSIGIDDEGCVRRVGTRFDLGGEVGSGVYTWANVVSARALDTLPDRAAFSHLDDWLIPRLAAGARDIRAVIAGPEECIWQPVGTPAEYLAANLELPPLSYMDRVMGDTTRYADTTDDVIMGEGATLCPGVSLRRVVVWDGESVTEPLQASDGVFAGGRFHPCTPDSSAGARNSESDTDDDQNGTARDER
jgi:NDP-sugar pyrophosphorylase family protein